MNAKTYRPIIIKTLKDANANKPASLEALADRIISNMEVFDEMFELAGASSIIVSSPQAPTSGYIQDIQAPLSGLTGQQYDISQRIVPKQERQYTDEEIGDLRSKAIAEYKLSLPSSIKVQPPDFEKPLNIEFRGPMNSRGAMPFINLQWGAPNAPTFSIPQDVTGRMMSRDEVIEAVKQQAVALYFNAPKAIQPRLPPPRDTNLSTSAWGSDETPKIDGH